MVRPTVRTARLDPAEVRALRARYGEVWAAWRALGLTPRVPSPAVATGAITWHRFRLVAGGQLARPEDVTTVRQLLAEEVLPHAR